MIKFSFITWVTIIINAVYFMLYSNPMNNHIFKPDTL